MSNIREITVSGTGVSLYKDPESESIENIIEVQKGNQYVYNAARFDMIPWRWESRYWFLESGKRETSREGFWLVRPGSRSRLEPMLGTVTWRWFWWPALDTIRLCSPWKRREAWAAQAVHVQMWLSSTAILPSLIKCFGGNVCGWDVQAFTASRVRLDSPVGSGSLSTDPSLNLNSQHRDWSGEESGPRV